MYDIFSTYLHLSVDNLRPYNRISSNRLAATRRTAHRFGIASRRGALIRKAFYHGLDLRCDSGHINRLNKLLITAAGNNEAPTGFRFNQHAGIDHFLTLAPELFRDEVLHIPQQTPVQHKGITSLEIKAIAVRIDFNTAEVTGTGTVMLNIDPREPFKGTDLALNVPGEGTLVISLQIRGMQGDLPSSNRQYLAADIIAVAAPEIPECMNRHIWSQEIISAPLTGLNRTIPAIIQRE